MDLYKRFDQLSSLKTGSTIHVMGIKYELMGISKMRDSSGFWRKKIRLTSARGGIVIKDPYLDSSRVNNEKITSAKVSKDQSR